MAIFSLESFRGGLNNTDPSNSLSKDQCVVAENIELQKAMLGSKRKGNVAIDLGAANPFQTAANKAVTFLFRHLPSIDETAAELWALTSSLTTQSYGLMRKTTAWTEVVATDVIRVTSGYNFRLCAVSLHGKMFLAYKDDANGDRLHVWDGTSFRRVGLATPVAPSVANQGGGTLTGKRYYRTRYTVQSAGGTTLRRSEPSPSVSITPSGAGASIRVTKPATISESETHWEVEGSIDNVLFYRLAAAVVVGTTTYDDSVSAYTVGYAAAGILSEDVGDYTVPHSAEYLISDDDRLVFIGSLENPAWGSRISWTPAYGDVTGVGNDERCPIDTDNFVDADSTDGGSITGVSRAIHGTFYVFKTSGIYQLSRTGIRTRAYDIICITKAKGAVKGSVVDGVDQIGRPAVYFLDPVLGPCRLGANGIQVCSWDILTSWQSVNRGALRVTHGQYYPNNRQVHYWIATGSSDYPTMKLVVHTNLMRDTEDGARRGWVTWSSGRSVTALCSCLFADNIDAGIARNLNLVPFVGIAELSANRDFIQRCDTGSTDAGTAYVATVKSRPFPFGELLNKCAISSAALLAKAAVGVTVTIRAIVDYGKNTETAESSLAPLGTETDVINYIDDLGIGDARTIQFELGDITTTSGLWELNQLSLLSDITDQA